MKIESSYRSIRKDGTWNRVQVPDMGPEPAGFRFRSCDCGALVRARRRALRKRVIGTAVMALLPEPEARFLGAGSCALLSVSVWMRFFLTVPMYKINPFFARSLFMRNQYWENKHYAYFCNRECEYFPCHKGADPENFNCLFCYCPLYVLGDRCGGKFAYLPNGYKDCSRCLFPHLRENYGVITERYGEILAAIPYPDQEDDE